jgi:hypothetical protein
MLYVTGDIHGDMTRFHAPELKKLKKADTLFICGDFGFIWDGNSSEKTELKTIGKMRYTVCFLDGAHENFELLNQYPISDFHGGKAQQISGNLWHLLRGEIYDFAGKSVFSMGGGVSPDDDFRDEIGNNAELQVPSREELLKANAALSAVQGHVDFILTHEPPMKIKSFLRLKNPTLTTEPSGLNTYFEELGKACTFTRWYFGSMHLDKLISTTHAAVFRKILPMNK